VVGLLSLKLVIAFGFKFASDSFLLDLKFSLQHGYSLPLPLGHITQTCLLLTLIPHFVLAFNILLEALKQELIVRVHLLQWLVMIFLYRIANNLEFHFLAPELELVLRIRLGGLLLILLQLLEGRVRLPWEGGLVRPSQDCCVLAEQLGRLWVLHQDWLLLVS